jgi:response regulator RpfG family c-di-GMP phosphodiesterase
MSDEHLKLQQLFDINREIEQVKDVDVLLEKILSVARTLVNADAGSIYTKEGKHLKFSHTQNETLQKQLGPGKKLIYKTFLVPINHSSISGYVASTGETLNIPDVYHLAKDVPYSFDHSYDEKAFYRTQSMLTTPLKNNQDKVIGVMQLINAQSKRGEVIPFAEGDIPLIRIFANSAALAIERAQMMRTMILRMISMAELRDPKETGPHVNRVGAYAAEIYERWALNKKFPLKIVETTKDMLRMTAMLHDVGKVGIKDEILQKPGKLDPEEYEYMKQHTVKGARLFADSQSDFDEMARQIAFNHHERWDGTGYPGHIDLNGNVIPGYEDEHGKPRGKQGEEIPLVARVVAVADVYDALSCRRVYKKAWKEKDVLIELKKGAGKQFDPEIIDAFFSTLDTIHSIAYHFPDPEYPPSSDDSTPLTMTLASP